MKGRGRLILFGLLVTTVYPALIGLAWLRVAMDGAEPSRPFGTTASGRLEDGHVIPPWGQGYVAYSFIGAVLGRQYVDGRVRDALTAALAVRAAAEPGRTFVVGETGWPHGGRFRPHRSHQNGRSVDVFMPVETQRGNPQMLGIWPWNKFGYGFEFDEAGRLGDLRISFESVAALLIELDHQAHERGLAIQKVFIAPEYVPHLLATPSGHHLGALEMVLSRRPAWVRHDEHFHVDFVDEAQAAVLSKPPCTSICSGKQALASLW
jgi:penicillin-insensitive murein endopeptidase